LREDIMEFSRNKLKQGLRDHMLAVETAYRGVAGLLDNPEYRTAACLISIMDKQDEGTPTPRSKT
jgi:hypothetical protein